MGLSQQRAQNVLEGSLVALELASALTATLGDIREQRSLLALCAPREPTAMRWRRAAQIVELEPTVRWQHRFA